MGLSVLHFSASWTAVLGTRLSYDALCQHHVLEYSISQKQNDCKSSLTKM